MSPVSLDSKISTLKDRSHMLQKARVFFYERGLYEVDCPALSSSPSVDEHIDLIKTVDGQYLFSSPEYGMKRLLAHGSGDIFYLGHVYRANEEGFKHSPEFMMAEWYRLGFSFNQMIEETLNFIRLFVGDVLHEIVTYQALFIAHVGVDPLSADTRQLIDVLVHNAIDIPDTIKHDRDSLLNLILALIIEPKLPERLVVLTHYPKSQAALAQVVEGKHPVAERFEIYYKGLELCNGYHELSDPKELIQRFNESNQWRIRNGKEAQAIDQDFIKALEKGLPDCSGVAVGFDRLMMIRHNKQNIVDVICNTPPIH